MKNILMMMFNKIRQFTSVSANNSVDIWKKYYENGKMEKERLYVHGELKGTNSYDENGQIIKWE